MEHVINLVCVLFQNKVNWHFLGLRVILLKWELIFLWCFWKFLRASLWYRPFFILDLCVSLSGSFLLFFPANFWVFICFLWWRKSLGKAQPPLPTHQFNFMSSAKCLPIDYKRVSLLNPQWCRSHCDCGQHFCWNERQCSQRMCSYPQPQPSKFHS